MVTGSNQDEAREPLSWADVALASDEGSESASNAAADVASGDIVVHPHFGRCNVLKVRPEHLDVAPTNGRLHKLRRDFIELTEIETKSESRVYQVTIHSKKTP